MSKSEASSNIPALVGLVGEAASGKDTVAGFFERRGFVHQSSSDILREEIVSRGLTPSRALQTEIANEMREHCGEAYFVIASISRVARAHETMPPTVISGLYAPAEGIYFQGVGGSLIGVYGSGDSQDQYQRLSGRGEGSRDSLSYEEFLEARARENGGNSQSEANVNALLNMADFSIHNTGTLEGLEQQVDQILINLNFSR